MAFQIYNKELGFWVGESDIPTQDSDLGNTEVPLPGEVGQGFTYAFDESIQMWRSLNEAQWQEYLETKTPPVLTDDDNWRISTIKQVAGLAQQNFALTQTVSDLTRRVIALEPKETRNEGNV